MNKLTYILLCCIGIFAVASCSKDDDSVDTNAMYYNWQVKNDTYFDKVYQQALDSIHVDNKNWYIIHSYSKSDTTKKNNFIVVHVLAQKDSLIGEHAETVGNGLKNNGKDSYGINLETPFFKDSVTVTYKGNLIPFDNSYVKNNTITGPDMLSVGTTFDTKYYGDYVTVKELKENAYFLQFTPAGVVDGFGTALLYMHPGDRWRVFIPYNLGYGTSTSGTVPGGSTLIFDLYMKKIDTLH